jgi:hypothetical protein
MHVMMSSKESNNLCRNFKFEAGHVAWTTRKCALGLAIVCGVTLIDFDAGRGGHAAASLPYAPRHESAALSHAKALHAERRARFDSQRNADGKVIRSSVSGLASAAGAPGTQADAAIFRRRTD